MARTVLFSDDAVAKAINDKFEPVWVSVRPVPTVTIDFGNGKKITRTLHGNVASYVLAADGSIVDILPGLYEPQQYINKLSQLWWVHHYVPLSRNPVAFLADYHEKQLTAIKTNGKALEVRSNADMAKTRIEISTKTILRRSDFESASTSSAVEHPDFNQPRTLASWKKVKEDTDFNESQRRAQVHAMLVAKPNARPEDVTKKLYREVLHADIDDPYMGLGPTLFDDYPFREDVPPELRASRLQAVNR